jgi:hypothetical protein
MQKTLGRVPLTILSITAMTMSSLPIMSFANPILTTDLLQNFRHGEPWDRGVLTATKTAMFQQSASGGTDATSVSKVRLNYFTSNNCTGTVAGTGSYTTPNGTSYSISLGKPFGLVAASTWNVGKNKLSIADMTTIQSVALTLQSTNNNTPQANFSGQSFSCLPVTCTAGPSGICTSSSSTQSFTLKTTAAVGDAADGGVIGCQNTGSSYNLFNIVVTTSNQSNGQEWGDPEETGATSTRNGAANTALIVQTLGNFGTYAARTCSTLSVTGGFTSGWFLPSGNGRNTQINCLYNNRSAIADGSVAAGGAGFSSSQYWSSTERGPDNAWSKSFTVNGIEIPDDKVAPNFVRCTRAF